MGVSFADLQGPRLPWLWPSGRQAPLGRAASTISWCSSVQVKGPIKLSELVPKAEPTLLLRLQTWAPASSCSSPGVSTLARPGGGGTCCSWHSVKPFREAYFYQGRSCSWNPTRASPSPHTAGRGDPSRPSPHPPPRKPSQSPATPAPGSTEGPAPSLIRRRCLPSPIPALSPLPSATCPSERGVAQPPRRHVQKEGRRGCPSHAASRTAPGTKLAPHLFVEGTNDPTFWAEVQIWEMPRTHHGISAPEVQRNLKGHLRRLISSLHTPACSLLLGSTFRLRAAPELPAPLSTAS